MENGIVRMKPFLYQVAALFYERYGAEVSRLAFVFPNRRAGLFFQKYLSEIADKPLFSPVILTINDLFVQLSGKRLADRVSMLFILYDLYIRRSGSDESFDEFLYWGEMLLNDFDDIDKYMVDARALFTNVTDLREIERDFDYLSEEQIAAIRSFWSSFYPKGDTPTQRDFLAVWRILYDLYAEFRAALAREEKAYEGMIFREVVERLERGDALDLPYPRVIFVGLNALSVSEERFLVRLRDLGIADFYWDYASSKVTDPDNKASYFAARNLRNFPSSMELPPEEKGKTSIEVIGIPSGIGQAKQVYALLEEWCDRMKMGPEEALRTAVVLPDEHLLIPVLNAIPERIRHINVTMGYPLAGTPVASLVEYILALQKNIRYVDRIPMLYYRDVLPILNHRYILSTAPERVSALVGAITANNKIYIPAAELAVTPLLGVLFVPVGGVDAFSRYLIRVLEELSRLLSSSPEGKEEAAVRANDIEREFIFHYFVTVNRLRDVMDDYGVEMRLDTFFRLLKRVTDAITIPFQGEPLSGLQIMGVLETRALDFDRLIILSMNEGICPRREVAGSFIPYNLRRGFGLPTYEHQDSIWAYHFYRLIERAGQVSLLYDTRSTGARTGEVSRFVHQLRYHYEVPLQDRLVVYQIASSRMPALSVRKGEAVMRRLDAFRKGGDRALSASAINAYLDCPLRFYFSVVEEIREEDEVSEAVESDRFGSILHKVMEVLYAPFRGKLVTADLLKRIGEDASLLTDTIAHAFAEEFFKTEEARPLTGQNFLIGEVIRKYVLQILRRDAKLTPFTYLESERRVNGLIRLSDGTDIRLKGFIDRVDEVRGATRIIDYKSGLGTNIFNDVEALFDKEEADRAKAVMQVFLYCWMYARLPENAGKALAPGIYYVRTLFADPFDPAVYRRLERGKSAKAKVDDFSVYAESFEEALRHCLDEMFDPSIPFTQTTNGKACAYCMFKSICGK